MRLFQLKTKGNKKKSWSTWKYWGERCKCWDTSTWYHGNALALSNKVHNIVSPIL